MNIKEIRDKTGLSQAEFAKAYNIPKRTIENWEQGQREAPIYVIELLDHAIKTGYKTKNNGTG